MHARKISMLTLAAVAVSLALTACDSGDTEDASSSATSPSVATPRESGLSCTDQIDYAGDSRSNAEIKSIGEETGYCPPVQQR